MRTDKTQVQVHMTTHDMLYEVADELVMKGKIKYPYANETIKYLLLKEKKKK